MTLIKIYRVKSVLIFKMRCIYIKFHNTVLSVWVTGFVGIYKNHRIISYRNIVNELYYLVENGDVVKCMSFHFKSQLVEFTHEYELMRLEEGDGYYLNPYNVCDVLNDIAHGTGRENNG